MRIDLYATCWNEERIIPFFLRHYEPLVDRMIIFDDGSDDRSIELLSASPKVELRRLGEGESRSLVQRTEMNRCWKESRGEADWVIICDMDEHLYHPDLRRYLQECRDRGFTIFDPLGYDMVTAHFPSPHDVLTAVLRRGVQSRSLEKKAVFDPEAVDEINYSPGRHAANPAGRLKFPPERKVRLLHYKHLGLDYVIRRTKELASRKTSFDREQGWSSHYFRPEAEIKNHFDEMLRRAQPVF